MKKISFLLLFCALVFAQIRAEIARGTWGNGFSWEISNDSVLTVSGAGEMPVLSRQDLPVGEEPYTGGEINPIYPHFAGVTTTTPWYAHRKAVKQIVLQAGITSIAEYAFYKCKNLSGIQIPSSVTKIKEGAFGDCNGLQAIMFPSSVTSIGDDAFNFCSGLTRLTIPMSVKVIGHRAFLGCSNLANLTLAEGIETINSEAFRGLPLTSITIPASVKYIGNGVFNDCHALVNITVAGKTPAGIGADVWNYLLTANGASGEYPEFYRDAYSEAGWDLTKGVGKTALYVVPTGAAATYKKTVEWNKFFSTSAPI
ncbi:MAG: leucine-rich repeat domain-containing protein, partial [Dysgonamonadaceae bacterium]|nr:leucine-rich repeat domain-containing protein [Dysgonamonadaceae bacterium]